jgi:hypothetical protein
VTIRTIGIMSVVANLRFYEIRELAGKDLCYWRGMRKAAKSPQPCYVAAYQGCLFDFDHDNQKIFTIFISNPFELERKISNQRSIVSTVSENSQKMIETLSKDNIAAISKTLLVEYPSKISMT